MGDVEFLRQHEIIDYSVGVWVVSGIVVQQRPDMLRAPSIQVRARNGNTFTIYFGIIDTLQPFNGIKYDSLRHLVHHCGVVAGVCKHSKTCEARWKATNDESACKHPDRYAARILCFLAFLFPEIPGAAALRQTFLNFDGKNARKNLNPWGKQQKESHKYITML